MSAPPSFSLSPPAPPVLLYSYAPHCAARESSGRGGRSESDATNGPIFKCAISLLSSTPCHLASSSRSSARAEQSTRECDCALAWPVHMAAAPRALSSSRCRLAALPAVMAAALLLLACCAEGAAAAAGSGGRGLTRWRQLLRQRQVQYHLERLNKPPLASIEVHPSTPPVSSRLVSLLSLLPRTAARLQSAALLAQVSE